MTATDLVSLPYQVTRDPRLPSPVDTGLHVRCGDSGADFVELVDADGRLVKHLAIRPHREAMRYRARAAAEHGVPVTCIRLTPVREV